MLASTTIRSHRRSLRHLARTLPALAMLAGAIAAVSITAPPASAAAYPVETSYTAAGPYATTSGSATDPAGNSYALYYPSNYAALGFKSPIVTWGNGTNATPGMYSTLLSHFASYGFTVIASDLQNTGSGKEIDAGAHYLVTQNSTPGSRFYGHLDVSHVAAVGHSQGAGGATRAATSDPSLITTLMTFSLPSTIWIGANPDCPTKADCAYNPAALTQPTFFISTHGFLDSIIASPGTETAFYNSVAGQAALGIITSSAGKAADHNSVQNTASGGNPDGELGYGTAWLEDQLLGNTTAVTAFTGPHPELTSNSNWPGSACKE
jgi:pimeloyl-ACP methyl ester carboxylesterase